MTLVRRSPERLAALAAARLARARAEAIAAVNAAAGTLRARHITVLPGQEMLYLAKEAEARAWLTADPAPPSLAAFPLLAAEVGITAPTPHELAQVWANMGAIWRTIAARIETVRLSAVAAIEVAPDAERAALLAREAVAALQGN